MVQRIERARKQGRMFELKYRRSPYKRVASWKKCCAKFKENPNKFYTNPLLPIQLEELKLKMYQDNIVSENRYSCDDPFRSDSLEEIGRVCRSASPDIESERLNEIINAIKSKTEFRISNIENKRISSENPLSYSYSSSETSMSNWRKKSF